VVVDVIDHGMQESRFGRKHKVGIRWQIEEINPDTGKRFLVMRRYTLSLNLKATLRLHLEALRSRKFTAKELKGFDLESIIGLGCQLQVVHTTLDDGRTFGNVQACVPLSKSMPRLKPIDYVRVQDRPANDTAGTETDVSDQDDPDDDPAQLPLGV
jgi:hypothetical protein